MAPGVGVPVGVGVPGGGVGVVPAGRTVVDAVAELLSGLGSNELPETIAVLLIDPVTVGVTTKVTVSMAPGGRLPRSQVTVLVPVQVPLVVVAETKFTLAGKLSVIVTSCWPKGGQQVNTVMV